MTDTTQPEADPTTESSATPVSPPPDPAPKPSPPPAPATAPPAPAPTPQPVRLHGDPADYIRELREENKTHREKTKHVESQFASESEAHSKTKAERDQLARANAVILAAQQLGANAAALLDAKSLDTKLAAVDPSDQEAVTTFIAEAMKTNPAFSISPTLPPSSGGTHQGGTLSPPQLSLDSAVKNALSGYAPTKER